MVKNVKTTIKWSKNKINELNKWKFDSSLVNFAVEEINYLLLGKCAPTYSSNRQQQQLQEAIINIRLRLCYPRLDITMKGGGRSGESKLLCRYI